MSPSRFATLDKCIKTNVPELERNQLGSNFEIFDHQFTDVSLVSLHSLPRPDALHDRDAPGHMSLSCSQPLSPRGRPPLFDAPLQPDPTLLGHEPPQVKT